MARLFKRKGSPYWNFDFRFARQRHQGSTHIKNREQAESYVAKLRSDLALGLVGLRHREPPQILSVFLQTTFMDNIRQNANKPNTAAFYAARVKVLCEYPPFTQLRLDRIDELAIQGYKDSRLAKQLRPTTINAELRTLRKAMIFADTCGLVRYRRIHALPGETNRTFVLDSEMERRYLDVAQYPLREAAILMLDLGLRPEECVCLRKIDIAENSVSVQRGKTANAQRALPQTRRTEEVLNLCFALFPSSEFVFPGNCGGHYGRKSLDELHAELRAKHGFPKEFVLHACRHTFATRLAESCNGDTFILMKALGHADERTCRRYVHVRQDYLTLALRRKEEMDRLVRGESDSVTAKITTGHENT